MTKDTGGPAFPSANMNTGMSLRDYFAAKASEEDIKAHQDGGVKEQVVDDDLNGRKRIVYCNVRYTREQANYCYADAILKARQA